MEIAAIAVQSVTIIDVPTVIADSAARLWLSARRELPRRSVANVR